MPIVLCQVFPSSATKKRPADKIKAINALYLAARQERSAGHVPRHLAALRRSRTATPKADEFPDLLHPNEAGYAKWAAALRPVLATLRLLETSPMPFTPEEGFEQLFNGRDLTGWGYRPTSEADKASARRWQASDPNAAAWPIVTEPVSFDGQTASPDGRFAVINGRLVVTTPPECRKIQQLWTTREFPEDFMLKLEFRATPNADSGVFLRGRSCSAATTARRAVQGAEAVQAAGLERARRHRQERRRPLHLQRRSRSKELKLPATGPIGLEGDRGQMEYRRIRIKTLPLSLGERGSGGGATTELQQQAASGARFTRAQRAGGLGARPRASAAGGERSPIHSGAASGGSGGRRQVLSSERRAKPDSLGRSERGFKGGRRRPPCSFPELDDLALQQAGEDQQRVLLGHRAELQDGAHVPLPVDAGEHEAFPGVEVLPGKGGHVHLEHGHVVQGHGAQDAVSCAPRPRR